MNIAELFVRLRADNSDLDRKLAQSERQIGRLHGSTTRLEGGFRSATLQTGRLGNQFASLAGQIAGVHPIVGNLAQVMGNFAVGGLVTVGILGATAIFATFYDVITKGARAAKKESDDLTQSLVQQAKAAFQATQAGATAVAHAAEQNLANVKKESGIGLRSLLLGRPDPEDMKAQVKRIADAQLAVDQAWANVGKIVENALPPLKNVKTAVADIAKAVEEVAFNWREAFEYAHALDNTIEKITLREAVGRLGPGALDTDVSGSGINVNMGLTKEQIKTRDALIGNADKNTLTMKDAITQSAQFVAGSIVNALNIGGGGRGSQIGGMAGGSLGAAFGATISSLGWAGGPIGGIIGGIAGSLIGGLFDSNKKAVNSNTQAIRQLTQAMSLNTPSSFKVAGFRNAAADAVYRGARNPAGAMVVQGDVHFHGVQDVKQMGKAVREYMTRGGLNPLTAR